jgi:alkyl hydroperoxide reductase subunit AhpF
MIKNYKLFFTGACPNCPKVKEHMSSLEINGEEFDAGSEIGMDEARKHNIMAVPAVVFFDENDAEVSRASNVEEIKRVTENKTLV